jgi:hypothetical protein
MIRNYWHAETTAFPKGSKGSKPIYDIDHDDLPLEVYLTLFGLSTAN